MQDRLSENFIIEVFAYSFEYREFFETVKPHLKYSFLQEEAEKKLWQYMCQQYDKTRRQPSIGMCQQKFRDKNKVSVRINDLLDQVIELDIEESGQEDVLKTFEEFIRQMMFLEFNDVIADAYNKQDRDKAYELFTKHAEEFNKFSMSSAKFQMVLGDFKKRQIQRKTEENIRYKIPTGIDELDYRLGGFAGGQGGPETGECVLWLGESGMGKSQVLVQMGISAMRQGHRVIHFQLEGTAEQALARYDSAWTGTLYSDMKIGKVDSKKMSALEKVMNKWSKNDIAVVSIEEFSGMTIEAMRKFCREFERMYGKIGAIIWDYLELAELGDGIAYGEKGERFRQTKLARSAKMLAMEFNAVVHTATQSNDIPYELKNDPAFVITRNQLSEDKGKLRPFDIFITLNQTIDERREEIMRLNTDKLREYKNGDPIRICNSYNVSRFYDRKKTLEYDWDAYDEGDDNDD